MKFNAGTVVITQGDPKSIISWIIRLATGSWWTHGFVCINSTEAIEAVIPRVKVINIQDRINELKEGGFDFIIMELPNITEEQRTAVASAQKAFVGRLYDIWNCVYFSIFKVWVEGGNRLVCSRCMTAGFYDGMGVKIFAHAYKKVPLSQQQHIVNLENGYCTPDQVLRYSDLVVTFRSK